jgi:predicted TIM-barrel fold metal-dependent hydrolase
MDYKVISADDHIDLRWMPRDLWTTRLPKDLRERGPQVVETESGPSWVCDGLTWGPWGAYTAAQGSGAKWALEAGGVMREGELRPTTPDLRLADMDRDGVDGSIMYGPTDPFIVADPVLRREVYRAYNDWLYEFDSANPERLIGVPQLPLDDPEGSRAELERLARKGFKHYNVMAARAEPAIYDAEWEPFWALAEEVNIPIGFHLVVEVRRARPQGAAAQPAVNPMVAGAVRTTLNMQGFQLIEPIAGLVLTGMLDRHPGLRLVMAEAGLAWVPHFIQSLDFYCKRLRSGRAIQGVSDSSALPRQMPSEYFRRQIWVTFQDDLAGLHSLSYVGEDRVMWASDYPHPASTWPNSQAIIDAQMAHLSPDTRQKVLCGNARKLYDL